MTRISFLTAAVAAITSLYAENPADRRYVVPVYLNRGSVSKGVDYSQATAAEIFDRVGVKLDWKRSAKQCGQTGIVIRIRDHAPKTASPTALAAALPFEGSVIEIYRDRIEEGFIESMRPILLAHVLVHEITHLLQRTNNHAESGIMKAQWSPSDYVLMRVKRLPLTGNDVDLIYAGIAYREAQARSSTVATARRKP